MSARPGGALAAGALALAGALTIASPARAQWPPPPPPDRDFDGVADYYDQCPTEHFGRHWNPAYPGCPGYAEEAAAAPSEPKPKRRGPAGTMIAGIIVTTAGFGCLVGGLGLFLGQAAESLLRPRADAETMDIATGLTIGGAVGLAIGVPVLVYGVRTFRNPKPTAEVRGPIIRVHAGLGSGQLRVEF